MEQENISKQEVKLDEKVSNESISSQDLPKETGAKDSNNELLELENKCKDLEDKYLRSKADLENARKRFLKDKEDVRFQTMQFACLPIIGLFDSFKMGIESAEQHEVTSDVLKGFQMILNQFQTTLKVLGVEAIEPKGEVFNPHLHEAMSSVFSEDIPEDHIIQVIRAGYKMGDRLIRPASVVVSKGREKK